MAAAGQSRPTDSEDSGEEDGQDVRDEASGENEGIVQEQSSIDTLINDSELEGSRACKLVVVMNSQAVSVNDYIVYITLYKQSVYELQRFKRIIATARKEIECGDATPNETMKIVEEALSVDKECSEIHKDVHLLNSIFEATFPTAGQIRENKRKAGEVPVGDQPQEKKNPCTRRAN